MKKERRELLNKIKYMLVVIFASCTTGIFNYIYWGMKIFIQNREGFIPQKIAALSVILLSVSLISYFFIDFIITPPPIIKPLLFFAVVLLATSILGIVHNLSTFFPIVFVINFVQGFGLYKLAETGKISFLLFILTLIQAALVIPSLDTFGRLQLISLFHKSGQEKMFSWFSRITEKYSSQNISQFYRDYIYLVSCFMLVTIGVFISKQKSTNNSLSNFEFKKLFEDPSMQVFFVFIISLSLIILRTSATDYISGWGRNKYSNMKENFNLILSIYTMLILFSVVLIRFGKTIYTYKVEGSLLESFIKSHLVIDITFVFGIFYYIILMAKKLSINPNYEIQKLTERVKISKKKGKVSVNYHLRSYENSEIVCKVIHLHNLSCRSNEKRVVYALPNNITSLTFDYDRASIKSGLNYGYIDISISNRNYKHRLYFSALHQELDEVRTNLKSSMKIANTVVLDQYIIIEKLEFNPSKSMSIVNRVGIFNPTAEDATISVYNLNELNDKSFDIYFLDSNGKRCDTLTIPSNQHLPNSIIIKCNYKKIIRSLSNHHVIASIEFEINDYETIKLPYILEIEPIIYNDINNKVSIEYPDSTKDIILPNEIKKNRGSNIPVRADINGRIIFFQMRSGLNLLSKVDSQLDIPLKKLCIEISLVGLKGTGKTTYLTTLGMEAAKENGDINIVQNFRDKGISKKFNEYRKLIEVEKTFPNETPEGQFDSFDFQAKFDNKFYTFSLKDIAGEYFGSDEHLEFNENLLETANKHFNSSDYIFITIDTSSGNLVENDSKNLLLLKNVSETDGVEISNIRILFTKIDESKLCKENSKEWLSQNMPQTYTYLANMMNMNSSLFYYISIGKVENDKNIVQYLPTEISNPVLDIIKS